MEEEKIKFNVSKGIFYNPAMRFCRSISSLAVGAIGEKIEVVDAFCASGIRGIRYAKENKNVRLLTSLDIDTRAATLAGKNAKANKLKAKVAKGNISRLAFELDADFLEIDPFGTPSPYLVDSLRFFNTKKQAYLSVTATDVAVLCGGRMAACMKNYHAKPLNNEFTHEVGLRIMLKKIVETAAEFNMGAEPLISFSAQHYLKSIIKLRRSADAADDSLHLIGYLSYCKKCGYRTAGKFPQTCLVCKSDVNVDYAGPLWLGELHTSAFLQDMVKLNQKRDYADRDRIAHMLSLMVSEVGLPPYFYNLHAFCKTLKLGEVKPFDAILESIRASGYRAVRSHFSPLAVKTDAPYDIIAKSMGVK